MEVQNFAMICPKILLLEPRLQSKYVDYAFLGQQTVNQWELEQTVLKFDYWWILEAETEFSNLWSFLFCSVFQNYSSKS